MNALDLVQRSASLERPPAPPSKREMRERIAQKIAEYDRHAAQTGYTGRAAWVIEDDGTEHWWHEGPDGQMVPYP